MEDKQSELLLELGEAWLAKVNLHRKGQALQCVLASIA